MKIKILVFILFCLPLSILAQEDAWIYLTDKEDIATSIADPISILTQKAIDRKNAHGVTIDARDVPVNEAYITQLKNATGITVMAKSKWFNAVHVRGTQIDIQALTSLIFVDSIDFADKSLNGKSTTTKLNQKTPFKLESTFTTFNYGEAANQIEMFNGHELHFADYTGTGMTVAVLDAGFPKVNSMTSFQRLRNAGNLLGSYDFVNRDIDVYNSTTSSHGTWVLSDMAGYIENEFVGTAPDASYYLFITEDAPNENPVEESYWVEAAERADSLGVDVINTSLGYTTYDNPNYSYTPSNMDGNTAYITKGANIAFEKGMLLVNSAGNSGRQTNTWQIVGAPADAAGVLSIGAVDANGDRADFSSKGSAFQPTQKPDVVAQGAASCIITENDVIAKLNGTSFSSPILAGGIVCLWQALPDRTNAEIMQLVRESGSQYTTPDYLLGYGIPNLQSALDMALANQDENLSLFPNPTTGLINLKLSSVKPESLIKLYNVLGKEIDTFLPQSRNTSIDISNLSDGLYILKFETNKTSKSFKIIKH